MSLDTILLLQLESGKIDLVNVTFRKGEGRFNTFKAMRTEFDGYEKGEPLISGQVNGQFQVVYFHSIAEQEFTPVDGAEYGWVAPPSANVFNNLTRYLKTDANARLRIQLGASIAAAKAAAQGVDLQLFVDNTQPQLEEPSNES